jgi:hypothetical protein
MWFLRPWGRGIMKSICFWRINDCGADKSRFSPYPILRGISETNGHYVTFYDVSVLVLYLQVNSRCLTEKTIGLSMIARSRDMSQFINHSVVHGRELSSMTIEYDSGSSYDLPREIWAREVCYNRWYKLNGHFIFDRSGRLQTTCTNQ